MPSEAQQVEGTPVALAPPPLQRSVSERYGAGASQLSEEQRSDLEHLAKEAKMAEVRAEKEADEDRRRALLQEAADRYRSAKAILDRPMSGLQRVLAELRQLQPLRSDEDFEEQMETRKIKFPSTPHLKNLGAATKDDKLLDARMRKEFVGSGQVISVEEKIDGANLGISLNSQYQLRFQGRSKWVTSASDTQFRGLDEWTEQYGGAVTELLTRNDEILFGEWCAFIHTVPYDSLPGYFVAFDIYSLKEEKFLSRESFHKRLRSASRKIPVVPLLGRRAFTEAEIMAFLTRPATFGPHTLDTDGTLKTNTLEGVYLRIDQQSNADEESYLLARCKLVRPEFQQAIDDEGSWRGRGKNSLNFDFADRYLETCFSLAPADDEAAPAEFADGFGGR